MVLKKLTSVLNKRPSANATDNSAQDPDSPEAHVARGVKLFCESGSANSGEEVLHLPTIVDNAVASPAAAAAAAYQIRKFLSKDNFGKPHVQYNAVMLIRILADNPGPTFTRNVDAKFVDTIKVQLRQGPDPSVQQILRETLDALIREKAADANLTELFNLWRKETGHLPGYPYGPRTMNAPPWDPRHPPQPQVFQPPPQEAYSASRSHSHSHSRTRTLPPPAELAGRIEEARTSAKLLLQLVQSTPPAELLQNELVKEFAERCQMAQRSVQGYINCEHPPPDDDTLLTLIETNEQLSMASSKHQRAVLQARKVLGRTASGNSIPTTAAAAAASGSSTPTPEWQQRGEGEGFMPPPGPPPGHLQQQQQYQPQQPPSLLDTANPSSSPAAQNPYILPPLAPQTTSAPSDPYSIPIPIPTPPPRRYGTADTTAEAAPAEHAADVANPFADRYYDDDVVTAAAGDDASEAAPRLPPRDASYLRRQDEAVAGGVMTGGAGVVGPGPMTTAATAGLLDGEGGGVEGGRGGAGAQGGTGGTGAAGGTGGGMWRY